jgi:hypothetical protein
MMILSIDLQYRLRSETRVAVCLILGPVFVLWLGASVGICFRGEWEVALNDSIGMSGLTGITPAAASYYAMNA